MKNVLSWIAAVKSVTWNSCYNINPNTINYGCWNVAKRIFMWYQNIFSFNQNKFIFNKIYLCDIKIYFYSIKTNLYSKRNIFVIWLFFVQLKYFLLYEFFIRYFLMTISGLLFLFAKVRILLSGYKSTML